MEIIEIIKTIIIGIIQGITEWLPISSTGHMILANEFLKLNVSESFWQMFLVVIQFGSILAVVVLYFKKLNPFSASHRKNYIKENPNAGFFAKQWAIFKPETVSLWCKVIVAVVPAGIIGVLFDDFLEEKLYNYITVAITLILYGILFILLENNPKTPKFKDFDSITYKTALLIGAFQVLALIPGTSRSGSTILGAVFLGCSRAVAAEFSFFLAIPVMLGASVLKIGKYAIDQSEAGLALFTSNEWVTLILGMVVAFVVSLFAIKFLVSFVKKHDFKVFGYYRIVLGIIVIAYFLISNFVL